MSKYNNCFRWRDDPDYVYRPKADIAYDDIVEKSDFAHLKEQNRIQRLSQEGAGQSSGAGLYDFPKGDFSKSDPDDALIALRSGRLDRADVSEIQRTLERINTENLTDFEAKKVKELQEKVSKERQEFVDKELGFTPTSVNNDA